MMGKKNKLQILKKINLMTSKDLTKIVKIIHLATIIVLINELFTIN